MKISFILLISICSLNINLGQNTRTLSDFNAVDVSTSIKAELIKSDVSKIEIEMVKGDEEDLVTEVNGGTLKVKIKGKWMWGRNNSKANVKIYYKTLEGIDVSAGALVQSEDQINCRSMVIDASSGASCAVGLKCVKLNADASSGARITIKGMAEEAVYEASSGATIDAKYFELKKANADVSSGASIDLWATKTLVADASSGGSIKYKGEPEDLTKSTGMSGGSIKRRD